MKNSFCKVVSTLTLRKFCFNNFKCLHNMRKQELLQDVVIKFAGDSGDGMQLTGSQFTNNTALLGIDLATFPDFPAEIRAPQGTVPGVSGFQLRFSSDRVFTPGDLCDVLVAMNAAALKVNVKSLKQGGKNYCQYRWLRCKKFAARQLCRWCKSFGEWQP